MPLIVLGHAAGPPHRCSAATAHPAAPQRQRHGRLGRGDRVRRRRSTGGRRRSSSSCPPTSRYVLRSARRAGRAASPCTASRRSTSTRSTPASTGRASRAAARASTRPRWARSCSRRARASTVSTADVCFFMLALSCAEEDGDLEAAAGHWLSCVEAGDMRGLFGLGYTLFDLEPPPRGLHPPAPLLRARRRTTRGRGCGSAARPRRSASSTRPRAAYRTRDPPRARGLVPHRRRRRACASSSAAPARSSPGEPHWGAHPMRRKALVPMTKAEFPPERRTGASHGSRCGGASTVSPEHAAARGRAKA